MEQPRRCKASIRAGIQNVTEASMKLGEAIYKAQPKRTGGRGRGYGRNRRWPRSPVDDDIVDADFEEVRDDDNKKS
jgi:molecular chaperone DnaK